MTLWLGLLLSESTNWRTPCKLKPSDTHNCLETKIHKAMGKNLFSFIEFYEACAPLSPLVCTGCFKLTFFMCHKLISKAMPSKLSLTRYFLYSTKIFRFTRYLDLGAQLYRVVEPSKRLRSRKFLRCYKSFVWIQRRTYYHNLIIIWPIQSTVWLFTLQLFTSATRRTNYIYERVANYIYPRGENYIYQRGTNYTYLKRVNYTYLKRANYLSTKIKLYLFRKSTLYPFIRSKLYLSKKSKPYLFKKSKLHLSNKSKLHLSKKSKLTISSVLFSLQSTVIA